MIDEDELSCLEPAQLADYLRTAASWFLPQQTPPNLPTEPGTAFLLYDLSGILKDKLGGGCVLPVQWRRERDDQTSSGDSRRLPASLHELAEKVRVAWQKNDGSLGESLFLHLSPVMGDLDLSTLPFSGDSPFASLALAFRSAQFGTRLQAWFFATGGWDSSSLRPVQESSLEGKIQAISKLRLPSCQLWLHPEQEARAQELTLSQKATQWDIKTFTVADKLETQVRNALRAFEVPPTREAPLSERLKYANRNEVKTDVAFFRPYYDRHLAEDLAKCATFSNLSHQEVYGRRLAAVFNPKNIPLNRLVLLSLRPSCVFFLLLTDDPKTNVEQLETQARTLLADCSLADHAVICPFGKDTATTATQQLLEWLSKERPGLVDCLNGTSEQKAALALAGYFSGAHLLDLSKGQPPTERITEDFVVQEPEFRAYTWAREIQFSAAQAKQ